MRLYIIRHGETDWNKQRKVQGHSDIPLNEYGRELARVTAKGLAQIPFDLAYTSPLIRAKETAGIILEGREIPVIEDERIQEISFGICEGMNVDREAKNGPGAELVRFFEDPATYCPPDKAESIESLLKRTGSFLAELYQKESLANSNVLISTHGAALRGMLVNMKHLPKSDFWHGGVHKNCAVSIVEVNHHVPQIIKEGIVYYES